MSSDSRMSPHQTLEERRGKVEVVMVGAIVSHADCMI